MRPYFLYLLLVSTSGFVFGQNSTSPFKFNLPTSGPEQCTGDSCRLTPPSIGKLKRNGRFKFLKTETLDRAIEGRVIESREEAESVFSEEYERKKTGKRPRSIYVLVARSDDKCHPCNDLKAYLTEHREEIGDNVMVLMIDPSTSEGHALCTDVYPTSMFGSGYAYPYDPSSQRFQGPVKLSTPSDIRHRIEAELAAAAQG